VGILRRKPARSNPQTSERYTSAPRSRSPGLWSANADCRDGYTLSADAHGLAIEPGPKPVTLNRQELAQLGLAPRDDYKIPLVESKQENDITGRILTALQEAISRCRGPEEAWMAQDLKRAMILIGGLDEEVAQRILDQEGVKVAS